METHGRVEITRVEKNLHYLSLIARIAPMLGFIGTIAGVVTIFYDISLSGDISIKTISGGLYQKMVSSGAGLIIGVISFLFYHLLNSSVDGIAGKVERASLEFLDLINEPEK
jgi:biopolymer transport protein ExbB